MRRARVAAVILRQIYLIRGSFSRLVPLFVWVAVDMVLWGLITKYLNGLTPGHNFVPTLLGGILLWDFFGRVMQGVTMAFFEDVWSRNFLNFFATPLSVNEYLCGLVLTSVMTSTVGLLAMLILSNVIFGLSFLSYGLMLFPFLLILFLFGIALGIVAVGIVLRLGPSAEWFIWPIPALISPFAAVFYPLSILPLWMQYFAKILPPAYVFEGMRQIIAGGIIPLTPLLLSLMMVLIYLSLACWFFKHTFNSAMRTGLLARFSAENLT
ncbi:MAG: ABC transporter permease [Pseudomonadota bacterium]